MSLMCTRNICFTVRTKFSRVFSRSVGVRTFLVLDPSLGDEWIVDSAVMTPGIMLGLFHLFLTPGRNKYNGTVRCQPELQMIAPG